MHPCNKGLPLDFKLGCCSNVICIYIPYISPQKIILLLPTLAFIENFKKQHSHFFNSFLWVVCYVLFISIHGYPADYTPQVLWAVCVHMLWIKSAVEPKAQTCERCWTMSAWASHKGHSFCLNSLIQTVLKSTTGRPSVQSQIFTIPKQTGKHGQTKHLWSTSLVNLSKSNYRKLRDAKQTMGQLVHYSIYNCLFSEQIFI